MGELVIRSPIPFYTTYSYHRGFLCIHTIGSSTPAMATSSIITRGSSSLANFTVRSRPKVDIILANQTDGLVPSFTTGDTIKGTVTITVDHDTRFDDLEITFEGMLP